MSNALTLMLCHGCAVTGLEVSTDLKTCKLQPTWLRQGQGILIYNLNSQRLHSLAPLYQILLAFLPFTEEEEGCVEECKGGEANSS